jgi:hypothetical protein
MTEQSRQLGEAFDEIVLDRRRLMITHVCLGVVAAAAYWVHASPFHSSVPVAYGGSAARVIGGTLVTWLPYIVSWRITRAILPGTGYGVVRAFVLTACLITAGAVAIYLGAWDMLEPVSSFMVPVAIGVLLVATARICADIAQRID